MNDTRWLSQREQRTWRHLLWATRLLHEALDRQLQQDSGILHGHYVILVVLSEAPDRALTMSELAQRVHSSPSRLSHAAARLERAGWIRRYKRPGDRRRTLAQLTDAGAAVLEAAAPGHVAAVRKYVFDQLTPDQVQVLGEAFAAIHEALDPASARRVGS